MASRRRLSKDPQDYNLRKAGCTKGRSLILADFWRKNARQFKSWHPLREDTILREGIALIRMATSQTTEMQVEGEINVDEAVKEILAEVEAEEQDPIEGMGNAQIAEIYHRMKPEDQRLFRQFKRFHKQYYETHGHDAPSHQLTRGIIQQMFPGLPSADADTIAKARAELLATERLKELCKQLGLAVPTQPQMYPSPPEAPEYPPPPQPPGFLSRQDKERMAAQQQPLAEAEEIEAKPDVKPRRLATSYLGPPGLLRMIGSGDEDHIITRVVPGTDPMQDFEDDDPTQTIIIDHDTDASSDVDDFSEVSMASAGGIRKQEFQGLLSDIAAQHQRMAASLDALASRVEDMSVEQVEEVAVRVASETGHVRGMEEITGVFDKGEVVLILACGVRKYQEYQALKGKQEDKDIISYRQLQKKFGTNKRTLMEVIQGYKYRYPGGVSTKVPFVPTKPEEGEEAPTTSETAPTSDPTTT